MTATQPDSNRASRLTRRGLLMGIGGTVAAGVGSKYAGSPVGDATAVDLGTAGVALSTVVGGPAAVAAIAYGKAFGGPDDSEVADSLDWQTHVDEFTRAREDQLMLDQTLSSLERDVQLVENKAREQAIFNIYEQGVDSGTEADATAVAENAINEAYTTVQKSIVNSWSIRASRVFSVFGMVGTTDPVSASEFTVRDASGSSWGSYTSPSSPVTETVTLVDGSSVDLTALRDTSGTAESYHPLKAPDTYLPHIWINEPDPSNYSTQDEPLDVSYSEAQLINTNRWCQLNADLEDAHSTLMGEVSSMVDSYYQPAKDGEIDLYEAVGPQHLTETAENAKDYQEAAMALRAMGYPMSEQVVTISVPTEDGDDLELTGRLSWTAHSGNTLTVGETHNPSNIPGSIFAAVNLPEGVDSVSGNTTDTNSTNTTDDGSTADGPGADIIELTDEFTIVSAEGADGVSFKDRTLASSDTSNEEINQIMKENYEANKEATETVHETATGGGGGGFLSGSSDTKTLGIVAGGAALAALLLGNN